MRDGLLPACLLLILFCGLGFSFLHLTGLHYDEAFFAAPLYPPHEYESGAGTPWGRLPLRVTRDQGALKTWVWYPWLKAAGVSVGTVRLPALLAAALAAALFFFAVRRMASAWAALLALALLVTDGNYLLTSLYDAGPLALQHVLWCGLLYAAVRFHQSRRPLWAALACLCLALAVWDRLPGFSFSFAGIVPRVKLLDQALGGGGLFGFLTAEGAAPAPSLQTGLLAVVLLALPPLWFTGGGRRLVLFAAAGVLAALLLFSTPEAGLAIYQPMRLWPLPQLLIVLAGVEAVRFFGERARRTVTAVLLLAALANLVPLYQLRARLTTSGPAVAWSTASGELLRELGRHPGRVLFAAEWGILRQVHLLSQGRVGMVWNSDSALRHAGEPWSEEMLRRAFSQPETLFVSHAPEAEIVPGTLAKLDALAARRGLRRVVLRDIADARGRAVFQLFEYRSRP